MLYICRNYSEKLLVCKQVAEIFIAWLGIWMTITMQLVQYCHVWASTSHQHPFSTTEECLRRDKEHASPLSRETWRVSFIPFRNVSLCSCFVTLALIWRQVCEFSLNGLALWMPNVWICEVQKCRQVKIVHHRPSTVFCFSKRFFLLILSFCTDYTHFTKTIFKFFCVRWVQSPRWSHKRDNPVTPVLHPQLKQLLTSPTRQPFG